MAYLRHQLRQGSKAYDNVFRFTGRYEEAAFVRELFDEPATALYQVWSLIRTIDDTIGQEHDIPQETLLAQCDHLIVAVVDALEGDQEAEIVRHLLRRRDSMVRKDDNREWGVQVEAIRAEVINVVNNFFYKRLTAVPAIRTCSDGFQE